MGRSPTVNCGVWLLLGSALAASGVSEGVWAGAAVGGVMGWTVSLVWAWADLTKKSRDLRAMAPTAMRADMPMPKTVTMPSICWRSRKAKRRRYLGGSSWATWMSAMVVTGRTTAGGARV